MNKYNTYWLLCGEQVEEVIILAIVSIGMIFIHISFCMQPFRRNNVYSIYISRILGAWYGGKSIQ